MKELEVLLLARGRVPVDWILIALANETKVVGIFQFLDAHRIAPKLLVEVFNRAHVRRAPMPHLLFAVAADLLANLGEDGEQRNRDYRQGEHQRDQHVAALANL